MSKLLDKITEKELGDSNTSTNHEQIPFKIGEAYFFRTVTYHAAGKIKTIIGKFLVLEEAACIANSRRFQQALMDGVLNEVELVDVEMYLNIDSIVDAFLWKKPLLRSRSGLSTGSGVWSRSES